MGRIPMNIQSVKQLVWVGAIALGGSLAWEVFDFSKQKAVLQQYVPRENIEQAIYGDVEEGAKDTTRPTVLVSSLNKGFANLNWTGELPKEPVKVVGPKQVEKEVPKDQVKDLLVITVLGSSPNREAAFAYVVYTNSALAQLMPTVSDRLLHVGSKLKGKFSNIEVEGIEAAGVRFKFNDQERESELVGFEPYGDGALSIGTLGENELPPLNDALGSVSKELADAYRRPTRTTQVRRNHYRIGTESLAEVNANYTRILSNDIRYRKARDRSGRRGKGIEITQVKAGSVPAEAGLQAGDVLISVNDHLVTSESDLVNFIKRESGNTDQWEAVFESNGKRFSRFYDSEDF